MRAFTDTLRDLRGGQLLDELADELAKVVAAVRATGKKGSLTLTLNVVPADKTAYILSIDDEIKAKPPKAAKGGTIMYGTKDNSLSRRDPNQPELPGLSAVKAPETKEVSNG